jgi:hypothetical protein
MGFDSNHLCLADEFNVVHSLARLLMSIEHPGANGIWRRDHAEQPLAERVAPRVHGAEVAGAGSEATHRVRVHEADDVAAGFFSPQCPWAVGNNAGGLPRAVAHASSAPRAAVARADQRPRFLDDRAH